MATRPHSMQAFEGAALELAQLKELYHATCYAFAQTEAVLAWKGNRSIRQTKLTTGLDIAKPIMHRPKRAALVRAQLRELLFIRLISVLESYLVDSVRDVFSESKHPFKEQVPLQLTQAEILSAPSITYVLSKIINRECRALTSGGYGEIVKYYRKRFGLDLSAIPPGKAAMEEYHERRHIFVHRSGRPDSRYRKVFHVAGGRLQVTEEYLLDCFDSIEKFIKAVDQHFRDWLPSIGDPEKGVSQASLTYRIVFPSTKPNNPNVIQERYAFWAGEELHSLADIVVSKNYVNDRECEMIVSGETFVLSAYDKHIRRGEKALHFLVSRRKVYGLGRIRRNVPPDILEKVKSCLPAQPWSTGIHKQVAQQLGISNRTVTDAIQVLIARNVFKQQHEGKLID